MRAPDSGQVPRARRLTSRRAPVAAVLAAAVALFSLFPFVYLFSAGFTASAVAEVFRYPQTLPVIARTAGITGAVTIMSLIIGTGGAYLVVRTNIPLRRTLTVLLALPLAIPGFVAAYAVYTGNLLVAPTHTFVSTFWGAATVITLTLYPYIFLACVVAVRNLDPAQEEAARSLGRSGISVFCTVTIPQLRPAMASSLLIVALHTLSEFGAMEQLGQRTLTTMIVAEMTDYGHYDEARSLSVLLVALAMLCLVIGLCINGRRAPLSISTQAVRPGDRHRLGGFRIPLFVLTVLIVLAAVGPTVIMTFRGLSLRVDRGAIDWALILSSTGNSVGYGIAAGAAATLVGLPVSWWLSRRPSVLSHLTERTVWLAHSIPAAVLALSLVFIGTQLVPGLYKTSALLIIAYVILFLPLATTNQGVGLQAASGRFDDVAASLGSQAPGRLLRVSLPIALPGIATGALLVGLDAAKELTSTLMLIPFNTETLATGLWATTNGESLDFAAAAPYSLLLVVLGTVPVWLIVRRTLRAIGS